MVLEKTKKIELALIIASIALIFFVFFSSYAFDDLGFDFAGYALRYHFAFVGWIQNLLLGLPAGTFDGTLPAILPILFKSIGIGSFTLPVTVSVLVLQLIVPLAFALLGKKLGIKKTTGFLLGLIFVLNPFSFKFFNRYYEFAAWLFFVLSICYYYSFLEAKKFDKKNFALTVLFAIGIVLSHPSGIYFWGIACLLLILDFVDLKRFATTTIFSFGLTSFWLVPFFSFAALSVVSGQKGADLTTEGIKAASYFFALALPAVWIFFNRQLKENKRVFRLFSVSSILAIIYAIAPNLPILSIPFAHSWHTFFTFVLIVAIMELLKTKAITKTHIKVTAIIAVACLLLLFPVVARQYFFSEPRYSTYWLDNKGIRFDSIDSLLKQIPKDVRFESLPYDPIISAFATFNYGLLSLRGWGYNAYALKDSDALGTKLTGLNVSCSDFVSGSEKTATAYWIALDDSTEKFFKNCGLKKIAGETPSLFFLDNKNASLVDGAQLLVFENNRIKLRARSETVLLKVSWFPRWQATDATTGQKIAIEDAKPGMLLKTIPGTIIELDYGLTETDWIGIIISIVFVLLFLLALI